MLEQRPLNLESATAKAKQELANLKSKHDFVLEEGKTQERIFGWVFFYAPRKYLETRDSRLLVPGTGPLVIEKNGEVSFLSTAGPPERIIKAWEKKWREKHGEPPATE